jgi:hypothetical protein
MNAQRASSFAQSVSDMVGGFTFGATMHCFYIVAVAFFGGMVMAGGGGGRGREGGKEAVNREREARWWREACSMCVPAGWREMGGRWGDLGGIWE